MRRGSGTLTRSLAPILFIADALVLAKATVSTLLLCRFADLLLLPYTLHAPTLAHTNLPARLHTHLLATSPPP